MLFKKYDYYSVGVYDVTLCVMCSIQISLEKNNSFLIEKIYKSESLKVFIIIIKIVN
jgi:hypothetical protein